jgi:outer membrane protein assembly factor BamB
MDGQGVPQVSLDIKAIISKADTSKIYIDKIVLVQKREGATSILWSYDTNPGGATTSPAIGSKYVIFCSDNCHIYAVDKESGAPVWDYSDDNIQSIKSSPTVYDGIVYFGADWSPPDYMSPYGGGLYALDENSGALKWSKLFGAGVVGTPAVAGNVVVIGCKDHYLYAYDRISGNLGRVA